MEVLKREDVLKKTVEYFNGDEMAADVYVNKYVLKDKDGGLLESSPDDMHKRLASELHRIEKNYVNPMSEQEIYDVLKDFKYIVPQGGPISGIGNNNQVTSLSNCFVIGNGQDSYGGIMQTDEEQTQLMKRRGGVGHDLSHIRPVGSTVKNSAVTSTGLVSYMERYSNTTREVGQDGRRGALMLSLSIEHPDAERFMDAKLEQGKVTGANISLRITDKFMESVVNKTPFMQQFPVETDNPTITKETDASKMFDKIVHNAWKSAEPGILFWDTIIRESVPDCYSDLGFKTVSTNPCVVGDTLVAVADGRNFVSFKQLAEEGNDVPVYAKDGNNIVIKTMRNPRLTGTKLPIYKVNIEGGHSLRVTGNHNFNLKNGSKVQAKDLKYGDSLNILTKYEESFSDIFNEKTDKDNYLWLNNGETKNSLLEHRFIYEQLTKTTIEKGNVIHHIDHNTQNNSFGNLQLMSVTEHNKHHSVNMLGDKNPYHKMTDEWKYNFASRKGSQNHTYLNVSGNEIKQYALNLTKKLGQRFSNNDWQIYAKENNLPQNFSQHRLNEIGMNLTQLAKWAASESGFENIDTDPRLVKTYMKMLENGYNAKIEGNEVLVEKRCELCGEYFWTSHNLREISYCSLKCSNTILNSDKDIKEKRTSSVNLAYNKKSDITKEQQLKIYSDLKFSKNETPLCKDWEDACKKNNVPCRLKTKHGFQSFKEVKEHGDLYNHKVISVELDGFEDVYNGTVDDVHNYYIGGFEELTEKNKRKWLSINTFNCGEIPLSVGDSCRLLALNLYSYVRNPFTKEASFDFELFKQHCIIAQRLMDDIIDLELEKIDKILEKIESDPEPERIKLTEIELWNKIKKSAIDGRRAGIGITAEGDMLAAMGKTYGTKEATDLAVEIQKTKAINVYKGSCLLAKERGSFGVFDAKREVNNPFIQRLSSADSELAELLKYGRRNIALLTIAPTGTVSMMTQTTSGIEPVFMVSYRRRRKINPNEVGSKVAFVDEKGDSFEEYAVFHHKFITWLEVNGYDVEKTKHLPEDELKEIIKLSPYHKATSADVDWVEKVRMQGEIQKWVDHSISVTVNLPNDATEDIVSKVYKAAWTNHCKGITVYRDGSRNGVLITNDKKTSEKNISKIIKENNATKRPKRIECDVLRFKNNHEQWIGFVGLVDNMPYELFTGLLENFQIPNYVKKGWIVRHKPEDVSMYNFHYIDKDGIEQEMKCLNRAFNEAYWNIAKMASACLRHRMPIPSLINVIDTLKLGEEDSVVSWKFGIKRMLKNYIIETDKPKGQVCQECGSTNFHYSDGCLQCKDCGWSKCG